MSQSEDSSETTLAYKANISEIRSACDHPSENGKALYVKRTDGGDELVSSIAHLSAYDDHLTRGDRLELVERPRQYWSAYNTIARFLMTGAVKLSGGRDCFKRLCKTSSPGAKTLHAGIGVYFIPDDDIHTCGEVEDSVPRNMLKVAHLAPATYDSRRRPTNRITLEKGQRYLVAGDIADVNASMPYGCETMIVDRGNLLKRGIEVPGSIRKSDFWVLDAEGRYLGTFPIGCGQMCHLCKERMRRRQWPDPTECPGDVECGIATRCIPAHIKNPKYLPSLAEFECCDSLVLTTRGPKNYPSTKSSRSLKRVLDRDLGIRDWDHLSEMTKLTKPQIAVALCSVPSLGRRMQKEGNSFIPWASDDGISMGNSFTIPAGGLFALFTVVEDVVVELYSGKRVRFEEQNGVFRVVRDTAPFSEQLPTSLDDSGLIALV